MLLHFSTTLGFLALLSTSSCQVLQQANSSDVGIQEDFSEVPMAVIQMITSAVFAACEEVKKLEGVAYEQLAGYNEPDVNSLTLKYLSRNSNATRTYNINTAAQAIVQEANTYTPDEKLFIYIHGFTSNPGKSDFGNVSSALFAKGANHVFALDAGFLIQWWYLRSTSYVRFIGQKLGDVLAALVKNGISSSSIHIIGHSLGSHMASFAGKTFQGATGERVGRITGLDPAGPCFAQAEPELRLQASDADFVDVIHTNAGVMGIDEQVGHVDYYPNGGSSQPNCNVSPRCCHGRSWLYFCESILDQQAFPAVKCDSWDSFKEGKCSGDISYMGFGTNTSSRGKYYLQTSGSSPYGLGDKGLMYEETGFSGLF
ncbi:pancreatic lipase-related protein 2-like [Amyelois transitella]|uniref:pancreatic lipase-related protein 2-like n=1 Tax=Amyelois transitella TaxID=680683 RepID=UPI00298F837A|nr:pancreatic lipase-related protein 2-like [Amyelois transitella]